MEQALQIGADVVSGIPHFEYTCELDEASMKKVIELALKYDRLVTCTVMRWMILIPVSLKYCSRSTFQ